MYFSGRKYFKDNILNMETYDSKLDKVILNGNKVKVKWSPYPWDYWNKIILLY